MIRDGLTPKNNAGQPITLQISLQHKEINIMKEYKADEIFTDPQQMTMIPSLEDLPAGTRSMDLSVSSTAARAYQGTACREEQSPGYCSTATCSRGTKCLHHDEEQCNDSANGQRRYSPCFSHYGLLRERMNPCLLFSSMNCVTL